MKKTPREELDRRIRALQAQMAADGIEGALIIQNADLFYFTGTVPQGWLFIPASGAPVLFVRKNAARVQSESLLDRIVPAQSPRDLPALLSGNGYSKVENLGMELDVMPFSSVERLRNILKPAKILDVSPAIQAVRMIKSGYEIDLLKEASKLAARMAAVARGSLREGITELELSASVEMSARLGGHQGYVRLRSFNAEMYWGPVVSGADAAEPAFVDTTEGGRGLSLALPAGAGRRIIGRGEPVIFDMAATLEGYNADLTRTFCLGPLSAKLDRAYRVSLEILCGLENLIRPGTTAGELFRAAEEIALQQGLKEHFMGYWGEKAGFCGHGIGIELDEPPVISKGNRTALAGGMVLALEPKFTFPGEGVVGVEDNYLVTETGFEKLTDTPYDVVVPLS